MTAKNGNVRLILQLVLALAVVGAVAFYAWQRFSDIVTVEPVTRGPAYSAVPGSVTVLADKGMRDFKSEVPGRVAVCDALDPEHPFKKGDILLKLDTTDLVRDIKEMKRSWESGQERRKLAMESNIERTVAQEAVDNAKRFFEKGEASRDVLTTAERAKVAVEAKFKQEEFDNKKATDDYNSGMELKNLQLEKMSLKATEDGVIEGVTVYEGALINAGTSVATYTSALRTVTAKISEEDVGSVAIGQDATVKFLIYPNETFSAKVSKILSSADETQRFTIYLDVKVDPKRPNLLRHNMTGQVTVTVGMHPDQVLVPRRAIFNGEQVYVVKDGQVQLRQIKVGFISNTRVEVLSGLTPGEMVAVEKLDEIRDGQRVRLPAKK